MPVSYDAHSKKWAIGEGIPRYHTKASAEKAYKSYLDRGGEHVEPTKQHNGKLG